MTAHIRSGKVSPPPGQTWATFYPVTAGNYGPKSEPGTTPFFVELARYDNEEDAKAHAAVLRFALAWKPGTNRVLRSGRVAALIAEANGTSKEANPDEWHRIKDAAWSVRNSLKGGNIPAAASLIAATTDLSTEQSVGLCEFMISMAGRGLDR